MRYLGGKSKIRKQVALFLESVRKPSQTYFEPFVGAGWILQEMSGNRIASDGCRPLISMYKDLQSGWIPPTGVTKEQYEYYKNLKNDTGVRAFVGFGCSHSGRWFQGFASEPGRDYSVNAKNSLIKQIPKIIDVDFIYGEYTQHSPSNCLIYCDPPYSGTKKFDYFKSFDHELFWNVMRKWSKHNIVVISEYSAPEDFKCVLEIPTKTDLRIAGEKENRIERLFIMTN